MDEILARYPTTLKLTFGSIALGIVVGVIVGIISAVRQYSLLDKIGTFISLFWRVRALILDCHDAGIGVLCQTEPAAGDRGATPWPAGCCQW